MQCAICINSLHVFTFYSSFSGVSLKETEWHFLVKQSSFDQQLNQFIKGRVDGVLKILIHILYMPHDLKWFYFK